MLLSFIIWAANEMLAIGVFSSWVILLTKSFFISEYFFCLNTTTMVKTEGNKKDEGKDDRRYHEPHTGEDVAVHVGEVHLYHTHLRLWVVSEEHLSVRLLVDILLVGIRGPVGTAVHFAPSWVVTTKW